MSKSNTIKSLCLLAAFVLAGFGAKAQFSHFEQSFYFNANLPVSDFATNVDNTPMTQYYAGSDAIIGIGLGYRASYRFDVGFGEVSPYVHADFQWNALRGDHRDAYTLTGYSKPNYLNVPIYAGFNYRYEITDIFTPFIEFGLGADFLKITKEGGNDLPAMKYKMSGAFAWQVGAGTFFGKHVSAGLHFSGYGKHTIQYKSSTADALQGTTLQAISSNVLPEQLRSIGVLSLRIGVHF